MSRFMLRVIVPKDRIITGWIYVEKDGAPLYRIQVLAYGNLGSGDTQFIEDGNTPTGTYSGTKFVNTEGWKQSSYGPYGAIRLKAVDGNALLAQDLFGRRGLLIHGGALREGKLRATQGCLRVSNDDMLRLRETLLVDQRLSMSQMLPELEVTVQEH